MKEISFYDYGLEDVLCGRKTSTLRFKEASYAPGEYVKIIRQDGTFFGFLLIISIQEILLRNLSPIDASIENWRDVKSLKARLNYTYGELRDDSILCRIHFRYCEKMPSVLRGGSDISLPGKMSIISTLKSEDMKYSHIFKQFFNLETVFTEALDAASEFEFSCEQRAKEKLVSINDKFAFAFDEMATISLDDYVINVMNLSENIKLKQVLKKECELTIRTGLALKVQDEIFTYPVYRKFIVKPKVSWDNINEILYVPNGEGLNFLDPLSDELINLLVKGLDVLLRGGIR